MLFGSLTKLFRHMLVRAFTKQVYHTTTRRFDPIQRNIAIHKTEHFELLNVPGTFRPGSHALHGLKLAVRDTRRSDLQTVHTQIEQCLCNAQLLMRRKRNSRCLFPVAQGGIHYFYHNCLYHIDEDLPVWDMDGMVMQNNRRSVGAGLCSALVIRQGGRYFHWAE